jgi:hypothetical protein
MELLVEKRKEGNAAGGENAFDEIFVGMRHDVSPISPLLCTASETGISLKKPFLRCFAGINYCRTELYGTKQF